MIKWVMNDRLKMNIFAIVMSEIAIILSIYQLCSMLLA